MNQMQRAKREGNRFVLPKLDRSFYSVALKLKVRFQSYALLRVLVRIFKELKATGDPMYMTLMHGMRLAWSFSSAAVGRGYQEVREWRHDPGYIQFQGTKLGGAGWA